MRGRTAAVCLACLLLLTLDSWWGSCSHVILDPRMVCKRNRRTRGRLAEICRNETSLLKEISRGVSLGTAECGHQFQNRRWNCTMQRRSMRKILMRDTRETGFVNAITAAAVAWSITRACSAGALLECSCEKGSPLQSPPPRAPVRPSPWAPEPAQRWRWGGCADNVRHGVRKSRDFMDSRYRKRSDIKTLTKLHNNNAGRLAIRNYMKLECKCHGLSGSCILKSCWLRMPSFREVGNRLRERFDGASKVIASNDGDSFLPESGSVKRLGKQALVYSEESPDFCEENPRSGSLGTRGRECDASSAGAGGCGLLCCGRGHAQRSVRDVRNCRCRFKWCCDVSCDTCLVIRQVHTCL